MGSGSGLGNTERAMMAGTPWPDNATSHSQQSLHLRHLSHRWLLQASFVQRTQIRVDSSPQILQKNGMGRCSYLFLLATGGDDWVTRARQRCASLSITRISSSRSLARFTM